MGAGILIDYNDGRPIMEITAGLRAPSYVTSFSGWGTGANTFTVNTPLSPGSDLVVIPTVPVNVEMFVVNQTTLVAAIAMTGVTRNGDSGFTINGVTHPGRYPRFPQWAGVVMELLPAGSYNAGLLVSDSTDFTAISNVAQLMTCAWVGTITVNKDAGLPVSGIPFARWDNPNVSVSFDGGSIVVRDITYDGMDDVAGSVTIDLVIFNNTPPVGGDGITMTNNQGQVTFSTLKKPFVLQGNVAINGGWQNIGGGYIALCATGANSRLISGYNNVRRKGIVMAGGSVRSERNQVVGNYHQSSSGNFSFDIDVPLPLPIVPNFY